MLLKIKDYAILKLKLALKNQIQIFINSMDKFI